jgi:hypothetical protein
MKSAPNWGVQEIHEFTPDDLARPATRELLMKVQRRPERLRLHAQSRTGHEGGVGSEATLFCCIPDLLSWGRTHPFAIGRQCRS